jgi:hypothetical protein
MPSGLEMDYSGFERDNKEAHQIFDEVVGLLTPYQK